MLIKALCDYYNILSAAGKVVPEGYSSVDIDYKVVLTEDGKIDEIIRLTREVKENKIKKRIPEKTIMPKRTEKSAIDPNIAEHRGTYLFGLEMVKEKIKNSDLEGSKQKEQNVLIVTQKSIKSHDALIAHNLSYLQNLDSPIINAFRNFLLSWDPESETKNEMLLKLDDFKKSKFIFCLYGKPDCTLHLDSELLKKWELTSLDCSDEDKIISQCAITGNMESIARIHGKIKAGTPTGNVLVGFNNKCDESYGRKKAYNSNISESAEKKYVHALNYLLEGNKHSKTLEDLKIVFWAMHPSESDEMIFSNMLFASPDTVDSVQTNELLFALMKDVQNEAIGKTVLQSVENIHPDIYFYMIGFKLNSTRIAIKFIHQKKFADILYNIAKFQSDMQVTEKTYIVYLWQIKEAMLRQSSKKSDSAKVIDPSLMSKLLESIIHGYKYPEFLLYTIIKRIKAEACSEGTNYNVERVRTGIIKAIVNRNYKKEMKNMLDKENMDTAYLLGRLFAVLEKIQKSSIKGNSNRTIKTAYFTSAASKPEITFPKLIQLSTHHLNKVKSINGKAYVYYNKMLGEIIDKLENKFPKTLSMVDQGVFYIGYYQQWQDFYKKQEANKKNDVEEEYEA